MKIAYFIIAHSNPDHLKRLIYTLNDEDVSFYIHIDKRSKVKFELPQFNNLYICREIDTYWGGYSFIEAIIVLIQKAMETDSYDYIILLSGSDYPVRSNSYIKKFLKKNRGKEFINISRMPQNNKTFDRLEYFYFETDFDFKPISFIKRLSNRFIRKLNIKRRYPKKYSNFILYGGSAWWTLTQDAVRYINKFIKNNPEFTKFYSHTLIPDELFFQTILGNSPFKRNITNSLTYTSWIEHSPHPSVITEEHIDILSKEQITSAYGNKIANILFARKFSINNPILLDLIDTRLRK